jgi:hypothetical protein
MDDETKTWKQVESYVPLIESVKAQVDDKTSDFIDNSPCFGWLFSDEDGECPEDKCAIRQYCEIVKNQHLAGLSSLYTVDDDLLDENAWKKTSYKNGIRRGKWKKLGIPKFIRTGYEPSGRWVDTLATGFIQELGTIPVLPKIWHNSNFYNKYKHLGSVVSARTSSYISIILMPRDNSAEEESEGVTIVRFWTITPWHAVVDVVPELVDDIKQLSYTLGTVQLHTIKPNALKSSQLVKQLEVPVRVKEKCKDKHYPCTHRVTLRTTTAVKCLVDLVKNKYEL